MDNCEFTVSTVNLENQVLLCLISQAEKAPAKVYIKMIDLKTFVLPAIYSNKSVNEKIYEGLGLRFVSLSEEMNEMLSASKSAMTMSSQPGDLLVELDDAKSLTAFYNEQRQEIAKYYAEIEKQRLEKKVVVTPNLAQPLEEVKQKILLSHNAYFMAGERYFSLISLHRELSSSTASCTISCLKNMCQLYDITIKKAPCDYMPCFLDGNEYLSGVDLICEKGVEVLISKFSQSVSDEHKKLSRRRNLKSHEEDEDESREMNADEVAELLSKECRKKRRKSQSKFLSDKCVPCFVRLENSDPLYLDIFLLANLKRCFSFIAFPHSFCREEEKCLLCCHCFHYFSHLSILSHILMLSNESHLPNKLLCFKTNPDKNTLHSQKMSSEQELWSKYKSILKQFNYRFSPFYLPYSLVLETKEASCPDIIKEIASSFFKYKSMYTQDEMNRFIRTNYQNLHSSTFTEKKKNVDLVKHHVILPSNFYSVYNDFLYRSQENKSVTVLSISQSISPLFYKRRKVF